MKRTGERSAGNPHAAFEVAGAGNQLTVLLVRHSQRKQGETARLNLRSRAPVLDPTKDAIRTPTLFSWWKAKRRGAISRVPCRSCVVVDPRHVWKLHAREPGDLGDACCCLTGSRTAGEGSGRTTRMYVSEESDSGIVPMNHSNKIEQSMAESEEGRPLIKENIHQSSTCPTQSGGHACHRGWRVCGKRVFDRLPPIIRDKSRMR